MNHRPPTPALRAPVGYRPAALGLAQGLGRLVFGAAFELTVQGRELVPAVGPVILAGNHTGFLDGPLVVVAAPRRARALTKSELYRGSLGAALELIGQIPVRRELPDRTALRACLSELTRGGTIVIFPEGTRGAGDLRRLHRGVGWLAIRSEATVVPVACVGTAAALPVGSRLPRLRVPVTLAYGTPFSVPMPAHPQSHDSVSQVTEEIRRRLLAHLESVRAGHRAGQVAAAATAASA